MTKTNKEIAAAMKDVSYQELFIIETIVAVMIKFDKDINDIADLIIEIKKVKEAEDDHG